MNKEMLHVQVIRQNITQIYLLAAILSATEKKILILIRTSYNLSAMSLAPKEIAAEIRKHIPLFKIDYKTDYRQAIADSWPQSISSSKTT